MRLPEIVGIAGTHGAGKDTLAALRAEKERCQHVTLSDALRKQLAEDGVPLTRANLIALSTRWREESGNNGILVVKTVEQYMAEKAIRAYGGLSVVSVRHPDEARAIKDYGGSLVWVDAAPRLRYDRIQGSNRDRPEEDNKTFDEFIAEEELELNPPLGSSLTTVNLGAVRPLADIYIENDFTSGAEYHRYLQDRFELGHIALGDVHTG
jgi:cytidylate kinase